MGVIYKLREDVVHFIISQRQSNPLASCRQLAESTSEKFGLHLSKSSVHDVLKESGIVTPRGRKPKNKFEIPQEKKIQIQTSLSQIKLPPPVLEAQPVKEATSLIPPPAELKPTLIADVAEAPATAVTQEMSEEISPAHEGAGKIFLKAALWDLGVFSEEGIKATDWEYYLTYTKGVKVSLEANQSFFIEMRLPLERCIREVADGLINNIKPFVIDKVSDEGLFKACMQAQAGSKIDKVSIVDEFDHEIFNFDNIMEFKRAFISKNRIFVESGDIYTAERSKSLFFTQIADNNGLIEEILSLKGFETSSGNDYVITILIINTYVNRDVLMMAAEKLNGMYIYDEKGRLVKVKTETISPA